MLRMDEWAVGHLPDSMFWIACHASSNGYFQRLGEPGNPTKLVSF